MIIAATLSALAILFATLALGLRDDPDLRRALLSLLVGRVWRRG